MSRIITWEDGEKVVREALPEEERVVTQEETAARLDAEMDGLSRPLITLAAWVAQLNGKTRAEAIAEMKALHKTLWS